MANANELVIQIQDVQEQLNRAKFFMGQALREMRDAKGSLMVMAIGSRNQAPVTATNLIQTGDHHADLSVNSLFEANARLQQWIEDIR